MKALVFAAGLGTRLRPLTDNLPKALAPLAEHTLLYHVLMRLASSGVDEFVVNIHHFADKIVKYVHETPALAELNIKFSDESDLLRDTGGGIIYAEPLLHSTEGRFLIHNVDIVSDLDLKWFENQIRPDAVSTLLASERQTQRYLLCNDEMRLVGWTNVSTGAVKTPYRGLDVTACRKVAFAGIHCASEKIFDMLRQMNEVPEHFPLYDVAGNIIDGSQAALGQCFPIMDCYLRAAAQFPVYITVPAHLTLIDAGKPETLASAEAFIRKNVK